MNSEKIPSVSVIVPVYKTEDTLERAIESLLNQTFKDFEVLFAFDGGEKALAILEKYTKEHSNFSIRYHQSRMGLGKGRLDAIKYAKGDYIAFLDSDDYFVPSTLETLYNAARKENADLVNASFFTLTKEGKKPSRNPFTRQSVLTRESDIFSAFFKDSYFRSFMWTKLIRRSLISENPFLAFIEKDDIFEDKPLVGSLLLYAKKVVCIKDAIYVYNKTNVSSITNCPRTDRHSHTLEVYSALKNYFIYRKDEVALKMFYRYAFRTNLSLSYDLSCDRKNGASKDYLKEEKKKQKALFEEKELDCSSFQKRLARLDDID